MTEDPACKAPILPPLDCSLEAARVEQTERLSASDDSLQAIRKPPREDWENIVDVLDTLHTVANPRNARFLFVFGIVCSVTYLLPTSAVVVSAELEKLGDVAIALEGLTDAWRGKYRGTPVVINAFRFYSPRDLKQAKESLWKLVPILRKLSHQGIAPFLGVDTELFPLAWVYGCEASVDIMQYLKLNPLENRVDLLLQIARALEYLHSLGILHGALSWKHVLVDASGRVRLKGYGLATANTSSNPTAVSPTTEDIVILAPEVVGPSGGRAPMTSKSADVYALGWLTGLIYLVKHPFEGKRSGTRVALQILEGVSLEPPDNPEAVGYTLGIHGLIQESVCADPAKRPTAGDFVTRLEALLGANDLVWGTQDGPTERGGGLSTTSAAIATSRSNASVSSNTKPPTISVPTESSSRSETTPETRFSQGPLVDGVANSEDLLPGLGGQPTRPNPKRVKKFRWKWSCFCA